MSYFPTVSAAAATVALLLCFCGSDQTAVTQTGNPVGVLLTASLDTTSSLSLPKRARAASMVTLTSVKIVIGEIELYNSYSDDSISFERDTPTVLPLGLSGAILAFDDVLLPDLGAYDAVSFQIQPLHEEHGALYAFFPELRDRSVAITGHLNDSSLSSFTFYSAIDIELSRVLTAPFNYASGSKTSLHFALKTHGWFRDSDGHFLDPRVQDNWGQIDENISNSIEAYEDADGDGQKDQ